MARFASEASLRSRGWPDVRAQEKRKKPPGAADREHEAADPDPSGRNGLLHRSAGTRSAKYSKLQFFLTDCDVPTLSLKACQTSVKHLNFKSRKAKSWLTFGLGLRSYNAWIPH